MGLHITYKVDVFTMKSVAHQRKSNFVYAYFKRKFFFGSHSKHEDLQINHILKRLCLLTSWFGLFPYSIKYQKTKERFVAVDKSLYVNSLFGISMVVFILTFLALHIRDVMISNERVSMTEVLMTQMNYILELVNFVIFCVCAYVVAFYHRHNYIKMFNKIISTWNVLPNIKHSRKILSQLRYQINIITIRVIFGLTILQIIVNFTRHNSFWKMILVTITFNVPQTIQFIMLAFYYNLVITVTALLSNINGQCKDLVKDKSQLFIYVKETNAQITLRDLMLVYTKAFEVKVAINEAFQGPILASTIQCFHSIVSEAHIIYHGAVGKSLSIHDVFNCSIWIIYQILKIYSLAYSGKLLKIKALKIAQTLHNIPSTKQDMMWLLEVQHFSTLMKYQDIEITVYGYFPLDATLMFNIIASAMMYLVILVQFDKKA